MFSAESQEEQRRKHTCLPEASVDRYLTNNYSIQIPSFAKCFEGRVPGAVGVKAGVLQCREESGHQPGSPEIRPVCCVRGFGI